MSAEWKVDNTLRSSVIGIGLPPERIAWEQREFTPPTDDAAWYSVTNLPGGRDPLTLGDAGEDEYAGVFQIDVLTAQGIGVRPVLEAAGAITGYYTAGKSFTKDGQVVRIRKSEISPARREGVRLVVSVSVTWSSAIQR